jgi:hypothetical protein
MLPERLADVCQWRDAVNMVNFKDGSSLFADPPVY